MRIYMDTCCYKRPFDDQMQDRIYLETEIILSVLAKCDRGEWTLINSKVLEYEFRNDKDKVRGQYMIDLYCKGENIVLMTEKIRQRAKGFQTHGVKLIDSLHLATAESAEADILLSVDRQFVNSAERVDARVKAINPIKLMEEL